MGERIIYDDVSRDTGTERSEEGKCLAAAESHEKPARDVTKVTRCRARGAEIDAYILVAAVGTEHHRADVTDHVFPSQLIQIII